MVGWMNVDIYSDVILDVGKIMQHWFGPIENSAVIDMAILFFFVILIMFIFCLLSLPFRRRK